MTQKSVEISDIGQVRLYKSSRARQIKLSVGAEGAVRVTMPHWVPFAVGIEFAKKQTQWVHKHRPVSAKVAITDGFLIGKYHTLRFDSTDGATVTTRISGNDVRVLVPKTISVDSAKVQVAAEKAAIKALKIEASATLPIRLRAIAEANGFTYKNVSIKRLKSKWGSCSSEKNILLNCYLMQLPWHLIDYVIIHELVHTRIMAHGKPFWDEVAKYVSNLAAVRKEMRTRQTRLQAGRRAKY